jgi:hypothetical protein
VAEIDERLQALVKAARTLVDHAEEGLRRYERGDARGACDVVSAAA